MDKQAFKKQLHQLDMLICDVQPRNTKASQALMHIHKTITEIIMGLDEVNTDKEECFTGE